MKVEVNDLIEYCKIRADILSTLLKQAMDNPRNNASDIGAVAYFMEQEMLFRYTLPSFIKAVADYIEKKCEEEIKE